MNYASLQERGKEKRKYFLEAYAIITTKEEMLMNNKIQKKKVIPDIKVRDMEFIEGNCTREIAARNGAIMSNGQINDYRVAVMKGQGGSVREETWNRLAHHHNCCKSRVAWRHKTGCPRLSFNYV